MKKRGFTLVELLAVLVLIAAVSLIVFPSIINYINSTKGDISDVNKKLIIDSAKLYVDNNKSTYPEEINSSSCFTLQTLIDEKYLEKTTIDNQANKIDAQKTFIQVDYIIDQETKAEKFNFRIVNKCILYGDVNLDGQVNEDDFTTLKSYIKKEKELTEEALLNADVNVDGKVDAYDLTFLRYNTISEPLIASLPYSIDNSKFIYGDVNLDGVVTKEDLTTMNKYSIDHSVFNDFQKLIGDVNIDGTIDILDTIALKKYLADPDKRLPSIN